MSHDRCKAEKREGNAASEEIDRRGPTAFVRHLNNIDVGKILERLPSEMRYAARARRCEGKLSWRFLGEVDKVLDGHGCDLWIDDQHQRCVCK